MTDVALPAVQTHNFTTDAAKTRLRSRYRAETRFKRYGLCAIGLTAVFLVVVLADILVKGIPAFTQYRLVYDVKVDPAEIDPDSTNDPTKLRGGDYQALVRNELRAIFPSVTDRPGRRLLDGLLSSGAGDALRDLVVADPKLVGQTVKFPVLLSDDADLYFKGTGTRVSNRSGRGTATPSGTTGDITIQSSFNDFAPDLATVKQALSVRARALRREADKLRLITQGMEPRRAELDRALKLASGAADEKALKSITSEIDELSQKMKDLDSEAADLEARVAAKDADEQLGDMVPSLLIAINGGVVKVTQLGSAKVVGTTLLPLETAAPAARWRITAYETPELNRRVSDKEIAWLEDLREKGFVQSAFNWAFFTSGDSREPELAGIRGALIGSALTLLVTLFVSLPLGVAAAVYLEEFAPKNRVTELIEININNLAAVPSIIFGLLGLAIFLNYMGLPRSASLVGGLVLALLVLPTIIIASRAAVKAVPPSIKEAALGVGASQQQAIFHHVLPLAIPGIMTGTIIGMAHALGETAPLLLIGMVAFIVESPSGLTDAATVLPVQVYLWSDLPEIAFQSKTAAAIIVLLAFLFVMNGTAIVLRKRFEKRW